MSYAQGGTIQALDYNLLTWGGNTQVYTATPQNLAYVWGQGYDYYGYGQDATAITTVSAGGTVSATQWGTFVQRLNNCLGHQSGAGAQLASGSNIGITAGATISAFSNVGTSANTTVWTNANLATAQGTTTTGLAFWANISAAAAVAYGPAYIATRTVTFTSGDAARYFFNAGGQLNFVISNVTNNDASTRSTNSVTLLLTNMGGFSAYKNSTGGGRTGTSGTVNTNSTVIGYRQSTIANQTLVDITSATAAYLTDNANIRVRTSTQNVSSNGDHGAAITFVLGYTAPAHGGFNDTLNISVNHRVDIVYPETTYLANSWGTATVS